MKNSEKILATFFSLLIILLVFVYGLKVLDNLGKLQLSPETKVGQFVRAANPASVYCIQQGGELEIREDLEGNQIGYCLFPGGKECEEWAYFRSSCSN